MKQRDRFIKKMFEECGIILRKDGTDKDKIHIPGFDDYKPKYK